jgi:predicted ATPase
MYDPRTTAGAGSLINVAEVKQIVVERTSMAGRRYFMARLGEMQIPTQLYSSSA